MRATSGSRAGTLTSVPLSIPLDEVETVYSCVVGIHSKTDERDLLSLGVVIKFHTTLTLG